jgi:hypothetical protein
MEDRAAGTASPLLSAEERRAYRWKNVRASGESGKEGRGGRRSEQILTRARAGPPRDGVMFWLNRKTARSARIGRPRNGYSRRFADVAQLVEHFTRNEGVPGSSPGVGFIPLVRLRQDERVP